MVGRWAIAGLAACALVTGAHAQDQFDPARLSQAPAVEGLNFTAAVQGGEQGGWSNHMFIGSMAVPVWQNFGIQADVGIGSFGSDYTSAAGGLHIFWRDPDTGMLGIYGDWGYVNPEHSGRVAIEASLYLDRVTVDVLAGVRFGQHVYTRAFDEVDFGYYFTDNFKASLGHRFTSRGHVANVSFEYMPESAAGWSIYGEAEIGEDDYSSAYAGIRYSFGAGPNSSLIERDRRSAVRIRIPRNIADDTRCGRLPEVKPKTFWRSEMSILCASKDELDDEGAIEGKE